MIMRIAPIQQKDISGTSRRCKIQCLFALAAPDACRCSCRSNPPELFTASCCQTPAPAPLPSNPRRLCAPNCSQFFRAAGNSYSMPSTMIAHTACQTIDSFRGLDTQAGKTARFRMLGAIVHKPDLPRIITNLHGGELCSSMVTPFVELLSVML